jgi:hypothetical protein
MVELVLLVVLTQQDANNKNNTCSSYLCTIQWTPGATALDIKGLGHKANNSSQSNAAVKNGRAIPPLLHAFMA